MFMKINQQQAFDLGVLHAKGFKGARRIAAFSCACSEVIRRDFKSGEIAADLIADHEITSMANRFGDEINW